MRRFPSSSQVSASLRIQSTVRLRRGRDQPRSGGDPAQGVSGLPAGATRKRIARWLPLSAAAEPGVAQGARTHLAGGSRPHLLESGTSSGRPRIFSNTLLVAPMSLSTLIADHREAIIRDFAAFAKTLMPAGTNMTDIELRDHADEMLTTFVEGMRPLKRPIGTASRLARSWPSSAHCARPCYTSTRRVVRRGWLSTTVQRSHRRGPHRIDESLRRTDRPLSR